MLYSVGWGVKAWLRVQSPPGVKLKKHLWLERAPYKIDLSWTYFSEISLRLHIPWSLLGYYFERNLLEQARIESEREPTAKQWRRRADWHYSSFVLKLFYLGRWPYILDCKRRVRHGTNTVLFAINSSVKVCIWTLIHGWREGWWSLFTCQPVPRSLSGLWMRLVVLTTVQRSSLSSISPRSNIASLMLGKSFLGGLTSCKMLWRCGECLWFASEQRCSCHIWITGWLGEQHRHIKYRSWSMSHL